MENIKLVDCFSYFNEKELLEFRIKLLYDHVDSFIITEANRTHSGISKEYSCEEVLLNIEDPLNKINLVKIDYSNNDSYDNWDRERIQRDSVYQILHKFDDDCLFYFGDCDEILNPDHIEWIKFTVKANPNNILRTPLAFLNCKANLRVFDCYGNPVLWDSPFVANKKHLGKYTPSRIRESRALDKNDIEYSDIRLTLNDVHVILGWHFSWMGGNDRMKQKFKSYLHSNDFDQSQINTYIDSYNPGVNSNDPLNRSDHILKEYPLEFLPSLIFNEDKFKNFFLDK